MPEKSIYAVAVKQDAGTEYMNILTFHITVEAENNAVNG